MDSDWDDKGTKIENDWILMVFVGEMDGKAISKDENLNKFKYHSFSTIAKEKRKIYEDAQNTEKKIIYMAQKIVFKSRSII